MDLNRILAFSKAFLGDGSHFELQQLTLSFITSRKLKLELFKHCAYTEVARNPCKRQVLSAYLWLYVAC
jgi:hypothetical protein